MDTIICEGKYIERHSKREKRKMSTRLSDRAIVRLWREDKGHHYIKDPWTLSKVMGNEVKIVTPRHGILINAGG